MTHRRAQPPGGAPGSFHGPPFEGTPPRRLRAFDAPVIELDRLVEDFRLKLTDQWADTLGADWAEGAEGAEFENCHGNLACRTPSSISMPSIPSSHW